MGISYIPLIEHLKKLSADGTHEWETSFDEIEGILQNKLPKSAFNHRSTWANSNNGNSFAWMRIGWKSRNVDMNAKTLTFWYVDNEPITKKSPKKKPMKKQSSRGGQTTEAAPMVSVDVASRKDIQALRKEITEKMDIQQKEMRRSIRLYLTISTFVILLILKVRVYG